MIEVASLSYRAGPVPILHDIRLSLPAGGITALIGPNGAGKSSLLHCIAGLNRPAAGSVRIDGMDPFAVPDRTRARQVAILQQSPALASRLRVRELVAFGRWPHHGGRPGPEDAQATAAALAAFDLDALADRPLDTLSGGQRQRAMVAMAHAQATPWLLLDEPLNALDPRHARDLMARLHALSRPGPGARSVVVVLHDINAAAIWADRVVAMKAGHVIAADSAAKVLRPDLLEQVFDTAFEVVEHAGRRLVMTL
ncbi:ATP-binding cassette domain-containing protein [Rhodovulum steppense]|uniref:Iron complex transport system ATP-binding protein n=1 Tax=Rhodovulum steppense TaxID=540251 RepID=A0A4R1YJ30_9RHOB|nr:ATP-binding cassette domain-containing protein [Rhodovulum steppense]TCM76564.1 iron complex transport system ATP-binding protein [Rhodovulum steppense]